jgi:hypothetical protein
MVKILMRSLEKEKSNKKGGPNGQSKKKASYPLQG